MLFASNLDGAFVGNHEMTAALQSEIRKLRPKLTLVYVTGRDFDSYRELRNEFDLDEPDFLCFNTGTEISTIPGQSEKDWRNFISEGWNVGRLQTICENFPALIPQSQQFPYKLSFYIFPEDAETTIPALKDRIESFGIKCSLLYSADWFLDLIPQKAGKRRAVEFIMRRLELTFDEVITAGNFGSDIALLNQEWRSIVTANADKEVLEFKFDQNTFISSLSGPEGILEGLKHYNLIS